MVNRCAIYIRVSTQEQDYQNQLQSLERYADSRYNIVEVYKEEESAWRDGHQRELRRLVKDARGGKFKVVLVWALDRLSRQGALAVLQLVDRLGSYGVRVISLQEAWTEAPGELAEILYAITGWVARMESNRISERTKAGLARAAEEGHYPGRPIGSMDKRKRRKRHVRKAVWEY